MTPRRIRQPGPPADPRIVAVPVAVRPVEATLQPGTPLIEALAALLDAQGLDSACLTLSGGGFAPFAYVIPALSPDGSQAAFYSATVQPPGETRLDEAAITVGWRDGAVFFHCHALWTEADGRPGCGHVLPAGTVIASPITARGAGLLGARFEVRPDPETGFSLFGPVPIPVPMPVPAPVPEPDHAAPPGTRRGVAVRLAPNQQLDAALDQVASQAGFARAVVRGGVASIIGARFTEGPPLEGFATEMLVRRASIVPGRPAEIDVGIVDLHGTIRVGRLAPGDNPVLMTFEGVVEEA